MSAPFIRFVWATKSRLPSARWRLGLFGGFDRTGSHRDGVAISVRGLLIWGAGMALVGYLLAAAAVLSLLERRPYNYITYSDLVLPIRWGQLRELRGRAAVDEGLADLRAKSYASALMKIRSGLERDPSNPKGRRELAMIYVMTRSRPKAAAVLEQGLDYGYPGRVYMNFAFTLANQEEDYERVIRLCDRALPLVGDAPEMQPERAWLKVQKLNALVRSQRSDDALELSEADAGRDFQVAELRVQAMLQRGRKNDAMALAGSWTQTAPSAPESWQLLARTARETGRSDEMNRALVRLRGMDFSNPRTWTFSIGQRSLAGDKEGADRDFDAYMLRFGSQEQHLVLLADALGQAKDTRLLDRLSKAAVDQGFSPKRMLGVKLQVMLQTAEFSEALPLIGELNPLISSEDVDDRLYMRLVEALIQASFDPSDAVQDQLVSLVRDRMLPMQLYRNIINVLEKAERVETARQIVGFAQGVYPANEYLQGLRSRYEETLSTQASALQVARLPQADALRPLLPSAQIFLGRVDQLIAGGDTRAALKLIRDVRMQKPEWLSASEEDLFRRELGITAAEGDVLATIGLARAYVNGDKPRSLFVYWFAREEHEKGRKDIAVLLLKELLRKVPDYSAAAGLLEEWEPGAVAALTAPTSTPVIRIEVQETTGPAADPALAFMRSSQDFLGQVDRLIGTGDGEGALKLLRDARRLKPDWLSSQDEPMGRRELNVMVSGDDPASLTFSLRLYINGDLPRSNFVLWLAREEHEKGRKENALLLLRELLRKVPDFDPARKQLDLWAPPAPAA